MPKFTSFGIEEWMDEWQPKCDWDLGETCCHSLNLEEVVALAGGDASAVPKQRLTYGDIRGSDKLRRNIATLYQQSSGITPDHVLVTQGAIGANFLVLLALVQQTSHVVCAHPTYQQLYSGPQAFGGQVTLWKQRPDQDWKHDVEELAALLTPATSLVIINNPKNPTGTHLAANELEEIIKAVQQHASPDCVILSDEVYRPLFHSLADSHEPPPSLLEVAAQLGFRNAVATGSLSKAFGLAGIRVGWIAALRPDLVTLFADTRNYNVISVSGLDDHVAGTALEPGTRARILERNTDLARRNLSLLRAFMTRTKLEWVAPTSGTTTLIKLPPGTDDIDFCKRLACEKKVLISPGTYFDWPGWVRLGYVGQHEEFKVGLQLLEEFVSTYA